MTARWTSPVLRRTAPTRPHERGLYEQRPDLRTTGAWRWRLVAWAGRVSPFDSIGYLVGLRVSRNGYREELRTQGWRSHSIVAGLGPWHAALQADWTDRPLTDREAL